ncbi:MAG: ATP-binding protein [Betaproteobacteria bacterium]
MRFVPRSLFSRLVLVLIAVLALAQVLGLAVHLHERGELLSQASGMRSAQRIADIVQLLDSMSAEERRRIVQVLSAPPITIRLGDKPLSHIEQDADQTARAAIFSAMLRRFIGEGRAVQVAVTAGPYLMPREMHGFRNPEWRGMGMGPGGGRYGPQAGFSFVAQVRLTDATLVTFDSRQPAHTASWPYRLLLSLAVLFVAVIVVSLIAVHWVTRPLKRLSDAAEALGQNIDRAPLDENGPEEVVRAARAFNRMQARLQGYIRDRTRVLAAMSHDLKTPITRLRLRAELLDEAEHRQRFTRDLDEMETMVAATLDFLRGLESGEAAKPMDVMALLESLQADLAETGGEVEIEGRAVNPYPGKPQALKRCLRNLVENAVKYGKRAHVVVEDDDARLRIRIQDEGPGLPPEELEKVFEPFYRTEQSRSRETGGTGLGLTIARNIAEAHGGRLELSNRHAGGLEARLSLPRPAGVAATLGAS